MTKRLPVLALLIVVVILVLTNPSPEMHKQAVFDAARATATQNGGLGGELGKLGATVLQGLDAIPFQYNSYLLFSLESFQGKVVSVGALGKAIVVNPIW